MNGTLEAKAASALTTAQTDPDAAANGPPGHDHPWTSQSPEIDDSIPPIDDETPDDDDDAGDDADDRPLAVALEALADARAYYKKREGIERRGGSSAEP